jgi:hypothetical protein
MAAGRGARERRLAGDVADARQQRRQVVEDRGVHQDQGRLLTVQQGHGGGRGGAPGGQRVDRLAGADTPAQPILDGDGAVAESRVGRAVQTRHRDPLGSRGGRRHEVAR